MNYVPQLTLHKDHSATTIPLCQLHMSQFGPLLVVLPHSSQLLGDDQLGDVHSIAEQVRDGLLGKLQSCFRAPAHKITHCTITYLYECE